MKRFIKSIIIFFLKIVNTIFCFLYSIVKGFIVIPKIVKADSITIMPEGGFGHTVTAPDILRRLYPKKNNIFVITI